MIAKVSSLPILHILEDGSFGKKIMPQFQLNSPKIRSIKVWCFSQVLADTA